jgi:hypothetical protein
VRGNLKCRHPARSCSRRRRGCRSGCPVLPTEKIDRGLSTVCRPSGLSTVGAAVGAAADDLSRLPRRLPDRSLDRRREGGQHSGNWGSLLSNPAVQLVHALSTIVGPTGQIRVAEFVPDHIPASVRRALADCKVSAGPGEPTIDPVWSEPGLTLAEKVFAWCGFEILAMSAGNPDNPVNAIPPRVWARAQIRFVVGVDPAGPVRRRDRDGANILPPTCIPLMRREPAEREQRNPDVQQAAGGVEMSIKLRHVNPLRACQGPAAAASFDDAMARSDRGRPFSTTRRDTHVERLAAGDDATLAGPETSKETKPT